MNFYSNGKFKCLLRVFFRLIWFILFVIFIDISTYRSLKGYQLDKDSVNWLIAQGKLIDFFDGEYKLKYKYIYQNNEYWGERVSFTTNNFPKSWGENELSQWLKKQYVIGQNLDVHVNPNNPNDSVILVGLLDSDYSNRIKTFPIIVTTTFCLVFCTMLYLEIKKKNQILKKIFSYY